jgi:hypothetical protein
METRTTNQMPIGTWGKISPTDTEKLPKVTFDINIPVIVEFKNDDPSEYTGQDGGAFYVFDVIESGQDKVISTSAWTLLRGLKAVSPLKAKKIQITKKMDKGKQNFEVKELIG